MCWYKKRNSLHEVWTLLQLTCKTWVESKTLCVCVRMWERDRDRERELTYALISFSKWQDILYSCTIYKPAVLCYYYVSHRSFIPGGGPHRHPVKLVSDIAIFSRFLVFLVCFALVFGFIVHSLVVHVYSFLRLLRCLLSVACFSVWRFFCLFLILPSFAPLDVCASSYQDSSPSHFYFQCAHWHSYVNYDRRHKHVQS